MKYRGETVGVTLTVFFFWCFLADLGVENEKNLENGGKNFQKGIEITRKIWYTIGNRTANVFSSRISTKHYGRILL